METVPPLFQVLVTQKGWREYTVFKRRYQEAARHLADVAGPASLATAPPPEPRQFMRWLHGQVKTAPRTEARRVLEWMFPGVPIEHLFAPVSSAAGTNEIEPAEAAPAGQVDCYAEDPVMTAANESARFAARAESSNVGPHTMEQLEADIRRVVATYPNRPVGPLFREVQELRNRAFELLEGRQPPRFTNDLYVAAGILCGVLANASFDLGRYEAAETQARTAFMCGELAGHNGLRAWVRGLQALLAYWDGRPYDAVRLAEAGGAFTPEHGTAHIRLACIRARACGQLQMPTDAMTALHAADTMRDQERAGDGLLSGMMAFPLEKQLFYASSTHLWLEGSTHLGDAESRAGEALHLFEAAPPEKRRLGEMSLARMDLATARLQRGDLDGAALEIYEVLGVDARRRTESVRKRLSQFGRALALHPAATTQAAVAVREAMVGHQDRSPAELSPGGPP